MALAVDRSVFEQHFIAAAELARDFAREFVEESLPDAMRFRVHLNSSYDANATAEFKLFPQDSSDEHTLATKQLDVEAVIDLLWRDGFVPQWVDVMVASETGDVTVLDVTACGRFIADEQRLYYTWTDIPPFGPKGPVLPAKHVDGKRFSIHERSSCWSPDDLERARLNAASVWSLALHGPAFNDETLDAALRFPKLEILELHGVTSTGRGLRGLAGLPRLRHLRAGLRGSGTVDLSNLAGVEALETLALRSLPSALLGVGRLARAAPRLRELTIGSQELTHSDTELVVPTVERLTIAFPTVPLWVGMPQSLRWLSVHAPEAADADVRRILSACPEDLDSVGLRGTPVSDALFADLGRFARLRYVDAVNTSITPQALHRFGDGRPGFDCWPRKS